MMRDANEAKMDWALVRLGSFVVMTSLAAVTVVFMSAIASIFVISSLRASFSYIVQVISFVMEVIIALVAAVTSGTTVTLSIVVAACAAALTFPASSLKGRLVVSAVVSSASMIVSALAVLSFATFKVDMGISFAVIAAAAMSVSFSAAWAVGVLSLIERETRHVGLKIVSVLNLVRNNNYRVLQLLLKFHKGIKRVDIDIALLHAVKANFIECVRVLLTTGSANANVRDTYDNTALVISCETGSVTVTKMLLDAGAEVGLAAGTRGTAIHRAANWGYVGCVRALLDNGASVDARDGLWRTPLMLAAMHAPEADHVSELLLDAGCNVGAADVEQKTALHYAAERGLASVVARLLAAGADPMAADSARNTALHAAAASGGQVSEVLKILIDVGCDVRAVNYQRRTCLHLAAMKGDVDNIGILLDAAGPEERCAVARDFSVDSTGHLPIWYAVYHGHYGAAVIFVRSNSSLRAASDRPRDVDPLTVALDKRCMDIARVLLLGGFGDARELASWLVSLSRNAWTEENADYVSWLTDFVQNPRDLAHLCRLVVRECLGARVLERARLLPLPVRLQGYVRMDELVGAVEGFKE